MKSFIAILLIIFVAFYFPFHPSADDSPDWIARSILQSILVTAFKVPVFLRDYVSNDAGVWWLRNFLQIGHEACPETEESLIEDYDFPIHIWRPKTAKKTDLMPTLVMFHGGGWMMGDIDVHRRFYSNIAAHLNMVVVSPEYTRSPSSKPIPSYPDCMQTVKHVIENSVQLGINKDQIVLSGDSAGGQLTLAVGLHLKQEGLSVKGLVPLYPMTQILSIHLKSMQTETKYMIHNEGVAWSASNYITMDTSLIHAVKSGEVYQAALQRDEELVSSRIGVDTFHEDTKLFSQTISNEVSNVIDLVMDPRVSVLLAPDEMLADLPPCHIYAASHDILLDDAVLFHKAAVDAGNENIKD